MSNNCLKTQLKGIVDNDNLNILGQVKLKSISLASQSHSFKLMSIRPLLVKTTGTLRISNESEYTLSPDIDYSFTISGEGDLIITDKYAIKELYSSGVNLTLDLADISYLDAATKFDIRTSNNVTGDISKFLNSCPSIKEFAVASNKAYGKLSDVKASILAQLTSLVVSSPDVEGDIFLFNGGDLINLSVGNCPKFTGNINLLPNKGTFGLIAIYNSGITGSLDEFVASSIAAGRTTINNMSMNGAITQLTFNGSKQDVSSILTNNPCFVSWDNTGKISVKTGAWSAAGCTHVFCKGYTQEEAAEAFPGKTIIRVDA